MSFGRMFAVFRKELRQLARDKLTFGMIVGIPTLQLLQVTGHRQLLDHDPVLQRAVRQRNPYIDPLNFIQVSLLRRLRALPNLDSAEAEAIRDTIFLTINGIASGLRNSG